MGWIGRLFGTEKAISDITDKDNGMLVRVGGWFNDLGYTAAERAKWGIDQLNALQPFKIVQRVIASAVMFVFVFIVLNVAVAIWVKAITSEIRIITLNGLEQQVVYSVDAATPMLQFAFSDFVFWPIVAVLSLYMSGGVIPNIFGKKQ